MTAGLSELTREEWLQLRKKGVGASDSPAVCGLSPWKTPLHIYLEKTGHLDADQFQNQAMRWGTRLEAIVADAYAETTGRPVYKPRQMLDRHKSLPWMIASLDRLTEVDGKGRILECKTARANNGEWGESGTDEIPAHYLIQVQHQMEVTGIEWADVAVLIGGQELRWYSIGRSLPIADRMKAILSDFWARVEKGDPPPPDWRHEQTVALIEQVQRVRDGLLVEMEDDAMPYLLGFLDARKREAAAKRDKEHFKARLIHAMGEAETGSFATGHLLTRKKVCRDGYTVDPTEYVTLYVKEPKAHE